MSRGEHFKCESCLHMLMMSELISIIKRRMFLNHPPVMEEEISNLNRKLRLCSVQANQMFELWLYEYLICRKEK